MKQLRIILLLTLSSLFGILSAQTAQHNYTYDANGNRIMRHTVYLTPKVANPNSTATLPNGMTEAEVLQGTTLQIDAFVLKAYPNPTNESVNVALQGEAATTIIEVRLYNGSGSVVHAQENPGENFSISLSGMAAGTYIMWFKLSDGSIKRVRVVKL